jgi:FkbM family methyltransferase
MPPRDHWIQAKLNGTTKRFYYPWSESKKFVQGTMREIFDEETYTTADPGCQIQRGSVVVDGGAYIGMFSWYALMKGAGTVHAFEPNPLIAYYCHRNIGTLFPVSEYALWNTQNVSPRRMRMRIDLARQGGSHIVNRGDPFDRYVNADRLDDLIPGPVDFIKLDVEGSEYEALEGASRLIREWKPTLAVSLYHKPGDVERLCAQVESFGIYGPPTLRGGKFVIGIWGRPQ